MNKIAKIALFFVFLGAAILLGGIAMQMVNGISLMGVNNPQAEQYGYMLLSRGSILLIVAYTVLFISGILFWQYGPYTFKDRWFLTVFLLFYIWVPVDIYTIILDIKFAILFDPHMPITEELKALFMSRQTSLGPIPLIMLCGYLTAIVISIVRPRFNKKKIS